MPDEESKLVHELAALRMSVENLKSTVEDKFEAGLRPIEKALRSMALVPLALMFCGVSTALFFYGKITEDTWFYMNVILMVPFFGEGIRSVLDRLPLRISEKTETAAKAAVIGFCVLGAGLGCASYDRDYSAAYDVTSRLGSAGVTITPGTGQRSFTGRVTSEIDWSRANADLPPAYRDR